MLPLILLMSGPLGPVPHAAAQDDPLFVPQDLDPEGPNVPVLVLDLEHAEELALQNNLQLRSAAYDAMRADFLHLGSWGDFDWTFNQSLTYIEADTPSGDSLAGAAVIESNSTRYSLDLTRPLTTGGSFQAMFNASERATNSIFAFDDQQVNSSLQLSYTQPLRRGAWSEYATSRQKENDLTWRLTIEQQRSARQDLILRVRYSYWDLVAAEQQREVAQSSLDLGLELLEKRQRELTAGVGTEVEVLQARTEVATRIEALLSTENDVRQRADDMKLMLFDTDDVQTWARRLVPTTPLPAGTETNSVPSWGEALVTASDRRTELRQDRVRIDIAQVQHSRTLSEQLSGVDLSVTASSDGVDRNHNKSLGDTFGLDYPGWSVALTYTMPIGNRRANYAERSARVAVRQAVLNHDRNELQVIADVRKAVRDVFYRAEAVAASNQSLVLARRQFEVEQDRYEEGLSTNYQVLEYQRDLVEAESNERQARVELAKARVTLDSAQGILGEEGTR
jgi:outer membrane protein